MPATTPGAAPTDTGTTPPGGATSTFGSPTTGGAPQTRPAPASFTIPGFYGRGAQQYVAGEGRLARPRFRFTGSVSMGYDDNVFQTPTHGPSTPDQKVQVLETPAVPAHTEQVSVPSGDPLVPDTVKTVEVPAQKAKFRTVTIPGMPAATRIGSLVTRANAAWDVQFASRRTLFTFDLAPGVDYYWDRPGKKYEYNGTLALVYLRKLTGRAQFTAAVNASYQAQPDFSQVNAPTSNNQGSYLTATAKADLSYRLTPRFSTVTSVSYNTLVAGKSQGTGDYGETTFGTELRYLFSPRLTLLGELRYSSDSHKNSALDSHTSYLLVGGELTLSRRFLATLRLGESQQSFVENGQSSSSPFVEATMDYRLGRGTTLQWNARYGYEEGGVVNSRTVVYRSGLVLTQIFSPRLQGSLALNLLRNTATTTVDTTSSTAMDSIGSGTAAGTAPTPAPQTTTPTPTPTPKPKTPTPTPKPKTSTPAPQPSTPAPASQPKTPTPAPQPKTHTITTETVQDTIDATLSFQYILSRHWSLSLSYSYTMVLGPEDTNDYYRQRVFLGAAYQF